MTMMRTEQRGLRTELERWGTQHSFLSTQHFGGEAR
jgi:hypothetical protein